MEDIPEYDGDVPCKRTLAWSKLDIRDMGRLSRSAGVWVPTIQIQVSGLKFLAVQVLLNIASICVVHDRMDGVQV